MSYIIQELGRPTIPDVWDLNLRQYIQKHNLDEVAYFPDIEEMRVQYLSKSGHSLLGSISVKQSKELESAFNHFTSNAPDTITFDTERILIKSPRRIFMSLKENEIFNEERVQILNILTSIIGDRRVRIPSFTNLAMGRVYPNPKHDLHNIHKLSYDVMPSTITVGRAALHMHLQYTDETMII